MTSQFLLPVAATAALYAPYHLVKIVHKDNTHPLCDLPGLKGAYPIIGHFRHAILDADIPDKWCEEFGDDYQTRGFFNTRHSYIADIKALNHILVNDHIYQKGPIVHKVLTHLLGNGLLSVETAEHKSQRKILNPAFGVSQIRELTEIFNRKSVQLRDIWSCEIRKESGSSRLDVFGWLRKMTLDVIGEAGFNYQFNALDPGRQPNDLEDAFTRFMHSPQAQPQTMLRLSQAEIPGLGFLPMPGGKTVKEARTKMVDIAKKLLSDSQADIKAGGVSGSKWGLLSLLVQSNTSHEIQENQRLSDAEVIAQIPTFFIAGHETTSTATALALHALSVHPSVQSKLREELLTIATDDPTMDELNSLPYLENVVREVMHVYPPVGFSMREAVEDDVLPLSKSYLDRNGKSYDMLQIPKGTSIRIPISAVHRDKEIWGEDAAVFRPERWDAIPAAAGGIPSVWGNLKTFLADRTTALGSVSLSSRSNPSFSPSSAHSNLRRPFPLMRLDTELRARK